MQPDVVIVGGGVIGWSAAFHLLRRYPGTSVVVIDKNSGGGMGSTGLAAGGVRAQFSTPVNIALSKRSIEFFERFEAETGEVPSFRQHGYLFVTATDKGATHLRKCRELQAEHGVYVEEWGELALAERAPYIHRDDVIAANFGPKDGYLDPYAVCRGFEKAARKLGAASHYNTRVVSGDRGHVVTQHGRIDCGKVLLCPGHWSMSIGALFGIELPVRHERHMLALTGAIEGLPEALPMVVDLDTSFHFRREGEGLLIGCNWDCLTPRDPDAPAIFEFAFLQAIAERGLHRLPLLSEIGFDTKRCWAGYYAETPDHHAIIGESNGIYIATGFGGHGIMHSPASGEAIAQIIGEGNSDVDVTSLRPARFAEGDLVIEEMVI